VFLGRFAVTSATGAHSDLHDLRGLVALIQMRDGTGFRFLELGRLATSH
jgi:hypothetical protein